jgi:hypothetical protein
MSGVIIVNPMAGTTPASERTFAPATVPADLAGSSLVLFGNNKPNVDIFLDELERSLLGAKRVASVQRLGKLSAAFPAPPDVLDKVARHRIAVNAVGD